MAGRILQHFIDGKWARGGSETFQSCDPTTGEIVSTAPTADAATVDLAVNAADTAFRRGDWSKRSGGERAAILLKLADALYARRNQAAELIAREMGKPVSVNLVREVDPAVEKLRFFAGAARLIEGNVIGAPKPELWDMTVPEPVGVSALIIPWNDPLDLLVRKLGAALAAGCTVVAKSSEYTPASTALLFEIAHELELLPPGVINLVHGAGHPTGEALVRHPLVRKISFTGSTATGKRVMALASERLARVSLECGGKLPAIVFPDADLDRCLDAVTFGAFMYAGQSCTACTRVIAHEGIYDKVVEGVAARSKSLAVGNPLDPSVLVGPVAAKPHYDKAAAFIRDTLADGGRAVVGGAADGKSLFLPPTVFVDVPDKSRIIREEVFGPVLLIQKFKDSADALRQANNTPYGLGGSVWSSDINTALNVARELDVADVWINTHYVRNAETPYGGRKISGMGRELGLAGVEEYIAWKRVCIDTRKAYHLKAWHDEVASGVQKR